ncbi:hypothetical protein SAMN05920897_101319 [Alkalispirochaeta americana]|uniref:Uncharacterized protein n=1 Tax=Alkalispirochaeta americana TaxID=159291 RepID=A0A1N6NLW9_9SPIO|nr:hypothetical protein [Alkalispirochaeta americana]SIP92997.1 hypothetical protein SAMN05920897_101319 [Alkalispirochaeta americana]
MSDSVLTEQNNRKQSRGVPFALRLRSVASTRQTFARVLREYARGTISQDEYRQLVWGLSQYLGALRLEKESEIEDRLQEIEERLNRGDR